MALSLGAGGEILQKVALDNSQLMRSLHRKIRSVRFPSAPLSNGASIAP